MFKVIFKHELSFWKRNPIPYIFAIFLFATTFLSMWGMASEEPSGPNAVFQNSYYRINYLSNILTQLLIFLLPAIIGVSIFRDYRSRMYTVLYSYPFTKANYLGAKFLSSFLVLTIVAVMVVLGFMGGSLMPSVNSDAMHAFSFGPYLHLILMFIVPNLLLLSLVVFGVVTFTRNVYIGFVVSIMVMVIAGVVGSLLSGPETPILHALLDPLGKNAVQHVTKQWTLEERNFNVLPYNGIIFYNRLLWLSISALIGAYCYRKFDFNQFASILGRKRKAEPGLKLNLSKVEEFSLPKISYKYDFMTRLKSIWNLSNVDFRTIVFSWPFVAILMGGFLMVYFQQAGMAPQYDVPMLPTTAQMLKIPMFIFTPIFNLLTFLYAGMLIYKGKQSRMDALIDVTPQPNWAFMLTKYTGILKMQLVLLMIVFLAGIIAQAIQGYFQFEVAHYLFELFVLQFIHFAIWAALAVFVHTLLNNMYLSFFVLILIPIGIIMMPGASDILKMPFLRESVILFNMVPDLFIGFDHSAFNGYGSALAVYFTYKFYWALGSFVLLILGFIGWKRGLYFSLKERWKEVKLRLKRPVRYALFFSIVCFLGMGANIYYQEHYVSKTFYTQEDEDHVFAMNEIKYRKYIDMPQPKIAKANVEMDIYPNTRDFKASGELLYVNKMDLEIDTILIGTSFKDKVKIELKEDHILLEDDKALRYQLYRLRKPLSKGDTMRLMFTIENHPNTFLHDNSRALSNGTYITSNIIPTLGGRSNFLTSQKKRDKYGLGKREKVEHMPYDTSMLGYEFSQNTMDRIEYECVVSTSADQTALTMGDLVNEWTEEGRKYFHYKSNGTISNTMSWTSGIYEKAEGEVDGIKVNLYHHPEHTENIENFRKGVEASIAYCSKWFGALHHESINIVEFPLQLGTYATINGNLMPISETKWLCDIKSEKNEEFNHPFFVAAHEVAHYWWGHRVDPANVQGSKLVTESMAEYIAHKVVEHTYGREKMRDQRTIYMNNYFELRAQFSNEKPLTFGQLRQDYVNYVKGDIVMTTMSEYLGEERLNKRLGEYEKAKRYAPPPYPTSLDFVDSIRTIVPDSLAYLIKDLFETITISENELNELSVAPELNGMYKVKLDFSIAKHRADAYGKRQYSDDGIDSLSHEGLFSLPLDDYVKFGFYGANGEEREVMLEVDQIHNQVVVHLDFEPIRVVLDPDVLLLDGNRADNEWTQ